jgi:hypothetical protein
MNENQIKILRHLEEVIKYNSELTKEIKEDQSKENKLKFSISLTLLIFFGGTFLFSLISMIILLKR